MLSELKPDGNRLSKNTDLAVDCTTVILLFMIIFNNSSSDNVSLTDQIINLNLSSINLIATNITNTFITTYNNINFLICIIVCVLNLFFLYLKLGTMISLEAYRILNLTHSKTACAGQDVYPSTPDRPAADISLEKLKEEFVKSNSADQINPDLPNSVDMFLNDMDFTISAIIRTKELTSIISSTVPHDEEWEFIYDLDDDVDDIKYYSEIIKDLQDCQSSYPENDISFLREKNFFETLNKSKSYTSPATFKGPFDEGGFIDTAFSHPFFYNEEGMISRGYIVKESAQLFQRETIWFISYMGPLYEIGYNRLCRFRRADYFKLEQLLDNYRNNIKHALYCPFRNFFFKTGQKLRHFRSD